MKTKLLFFFLLIGVAATGCKDSNNCAGTISVGSPIQDMNITIAGGPVQFDVLDAPAVFTRSVFIDGFSIRAEETSNGSVVTVRVLENPTTGEVQIFELTPVAAGQTDVTITAVNGCDENFNTTNTFSVTVTQ